MQRRHRLEYGLFRAIVAGIAALPFGVALRLGAWAGELAAVLDRRDRRIALINLRIAFPDRSEQERRRILRASCRNLGRLMVEFCHLPRTDAATIERRIRFEDRARWEREVGRAAERGAIILTAHFGNWELLAHAHGLWGHPITLVHRPMRNQAVDRAIAAIRGIAGTRSIAKKAAAREAIRTLRRKEILVIPSDQNQPARDGVFIEVFGRPACTNAGAARLGLLTGAPVLPVFLVREGESPNHRLVLLPEVELVDTGDREADAIANTQRCSRVIEEMLRRYPEQWIWFHKRWKTRPPGEKSVYD